MFTEPTLTRTQCLLGAWVLLIQHNAVAVLVVGALLTLVTFYYSAANFKINTDIHGMMSDKLPYRELYKEFSKAFPQQSDTIVVVIDGLTTEQAQGARKAIAEQLRKKKAIFADVYEPGAGAFFQKNGLLYLNTEELERLGDRLSAAQPFLALLSKDLSIRGLFEVVAKAFERGDFSEAQDRTLAQLFGGMSNAFSSAVHGTVYQMSWEGLALGAEQTARRCRQFIILEPRVADASLSAGSVHIETIRRVAMQFGYNKTGTARVRITGDFTLAHENLLEARNSTGIATVVSLLLVALVLSVGLYFSWRLIFCSLITLIMGLIWSTAFALATVGPRREDNLLKSSMARATLFSNLATMISTASLAFSPHLGIASIGILLSICLAFLILSTLFFLPSLIVLLKVRLG